LLGKKILNKKKLDKEMLDKKGKNGILSA